MENIGSLVPLKMLIKEKTIDRSEKTCEEEFVIPKDKIGAYDCVAIDWKFKSKEYAGIWEMEFFEGKHE